MERSARVLSEMVATGKGNGGQPRTQARCGCVDAGRRRAIHRRLAIDKGADKQIVERE